MEIKSVSTEDLIKGLENNEVELIDVRNWDEHELINLENAKLIPLPELMGRMNEIDWTVPVVFMCRTGVRSRTAAKWAAKSGHEASNLEGGIKACWEAEEFPGLNVEEDEGEVEEYLA